MLHRTAVLYSSCWNLIIWAVGRFDSDFDFWHWRNILWETTVSESQYTWKEVYWSTATIFCCCLFIFRALLCCRASKNVSYWKGAHIFSRRQMALRCLGVIDICFVHITQAPLAKDHTWMEALFATNLTVQHWGKSSPAIPLGSRGFFSSQV